MPEDGLTRMSLLIRLPEQEVGNWEGVDVRVGGGRDGDKAEAEGARGRK